MSQNTENVQSESPKAVPQRSREFRIYRANKDGKGTASAWQLAYKPENKYEPFLMFLTMARQLSVNDNGDATFDWKGGLVVKLGEADLGDIMAVLEGRKESVGLGQSKMLFHQTPNGGNKVIKFESKESGFSLSVSAQDKDKKPMGQLFQVISFAEAAILLTLLRAAVVKIYGW